MPVYQITYKSGAQQFMEMDIEETATLADLMLDYARWQDGGAPPDPLGVKGMIVRPGHRPDRIFAASSGATLDVTTIAGFQHYIEPAYAEQRAAEDNGTPFPDTDGPMVAIVDGPFLREAMDAAIQAVFDTAEVEGNDPHGYIAAVDKAAVMTAFLNALVAR